MASNSRLLKLARSKDDTELLLRSSAALTLRAQHIKGWDLPEDTRQLVDYLAANPMTTIRSAVPFMVLNATIAEKISLQAGAISSETVEDSEIEFVVAENFDAIATAWRKSSNQLD